jgi:outer membrane protein assembly factor BamB
MTGSVGRGLGRLAALTAAGVLAVMSATGLAAAQSRAPAATGWPQFQGNARHTGSELDETSVTRANVGQLSVAWTAPLPATSFNSEVVVTSGVAYAGAGATVSAFNASSGTRLWQASLPGALLGTPSVQGGLVLMAISEGSIPHLKGFVVALSSATGSTVWMRSVGSLGIPSLGSSTTVTTTSDRAYVTLGSGQVEAMGLQHGAKIWVSAALPGCSPSQPSVAGGLVVVGNGGTGVVALHASDGTVAWHDTFGTGCGFSAGNWLPAISQGTVYAGLLNGVAALNLASGAVVWRNQSQPFSQGVFFPLALTGSEVIAGSQGTTQLAALSRSDGTLRWQTALPSGLEVAAATVFGGLVWALAQASGGGGVKAVAFGALTGHRLFSTTSYTDDTQGFPPVVSAGHVYVNVASELVALALPGAS